MTSACAFCSLLDTDGPAEWLYRDETAAALLPRPEGRLAPGHTLVIPTEHAVGVHDVSSRSLQAVTALVQRVAQRMSTAIGAPGVNVLNASGPHSDQSVEHLHLHVVPRWPDDELSTWPTGLSQHRLDDGWTEALRSALGS